MLHENIIIWPFLISTYYDVTPHGLLVEWDTVEKLGKDRASENLNHEDDIQYWLFIQNHLVQNNLFK